ncbi:hypothetical protein DPMN_060562 [Dreissena polymorpha]|uniref:Uncharacterized protein n=1 Tax=Dreissena polymorpha TaxID=45954 RepID=A0A9D4C631_DREPO|nr:hypothetical protein DPMN_060562 [Dreissena polymorpha]
MVLSALRDVSESGGSDSHVHVLARRIYNVENAHDELRQLDRMDPDVSTDKVIVFDLSSEFAYRNILRQVIKTQPSSNACAHGVAPNCTG